MIKNMKKYFQIPVMIWLLLILIITTLIILQNQELVEIEKEYFLSKEGKSYGDIEIWKNIKETREKYLNTRYIIFNIIGFWTLLTFLLQIVGFKKDKNERFYKQTTIIFGLLSVVYLVVLLFVKIIPKGSII